MKRFILSLIIFSALALTACAQNTLKVPVVTYNPYTYLEDVVKVVKHQRIGQYIEFADSATIAQVHALKKIFNSDGCFVVNIAQDGTFSNVLGFKDVNSGAISYCNIKSGGISYSLNKVVVNKNRNMQQLIEMFPSNMEYKLRTSPSGMYSFTDSYLPYLKVFSNHIYDHFENKESKEIVRIFTGLFRSSLKNVDIKDLRLKLTEWVEANRSDFDFSIYQFPDKSSNLKKERKKLYLCGANVAPFLKRYLGEEAYIIAHNRYLEDLTEIRFALEFLRSTRPEWNDESLEKDFKEILEYKDRIFKSSYDKSCTEKPMFQGQDANYFSKWVNERIQFPKVFKDAGIRGRITTTFRVNVSGELDEVKVMRGLHPILDAEVLRVLQSSPKWTPGKDRYGNPAAVTYTFPIIVKPENFEMYK